MDGSRSQLMATRALLVVPAIVFAVAAPAAAQDWPARAIVSVNGGVAPSGRRVSDAFDIRQFGDPETGAATVDYPGKTAPLVDGGVTFHVWRRLGAGLAISYASTRVNAAIDASLPHPFFLNTFRHISGTTGVSRHETAAHLQASYLLPASAHVLVLLSGGPSIINVSQPVVTEVQYSQAYPYDTATFTGAVTRDGSGTAVGFNAGGDVTWMIGRTIGIGGMARYTRGTATVDAGSGRTLRVHAGGAQIGAGVRFTFGPRHR
jgi:hypothetical protein